VPSQLHIRFPQDASQAQHDASNNLFNNAWGTNYNMWFGQDMRFRFLLRP
jgi:hypothetical protein